MRHSAHDSGLKTQDSRLKTSPKMQLLVSVSSAEEVRAAIDGGADIIDAKDPALGPLGAVSPDALRRIHAATEGTLTLSAALGDAIGEATIERSAHTFTSLGAHILKIAFRG